MNFDAIVIGAGAAGMMAASMAGQRGKRVALLEHAPKLGEKIRISGGGRCNFTNLQTRPENFLSNNPHFCRSALARYTPADFIELIERHGIAWHEKHKGQLFCDKSAEQIIDMLRDECTAGKVQWFMPCAVHEVARTGEQFVLQTDAGQLRSNKLIIATGGLSIPKIGATDFGFRLARQFGHKVIATRPALVPLTFDAAVWQPFVALSGLSLPVDISTGQGKGAMQFREDLLFTHRGLSGPAVLQISSYWKSGSAIHLNLAPGANLSQGLIAEKASSRAQLNTLLEALLPKRLADVWLSRSESWLAAAPRKVAEASDKLLKDIGDALNDWQLQPDGTEGYKKAEVTAGGVDTRELSQQSMESNRVPGLYFVGEVVDVTGWLGGYNFQWAWASGFACGNAV